MKRPKKGATKNIATASFQPTMPPTIPMSFTSPKPMASFLNIHFPKTLQRNISPPPASIPNSDAITISNRLIPTSEKFLRVSGSLCKPGHTTLKTRDKGIPTNVTSLGMTSNSRSTKVDIIRAQERTAYPIKTHGDSYRYCTKRYRCANTYPVSNSTNR